MRNLFHWITLMAVIFGGWLVAVVPAQAANLDTTADRVFGQPDFTHNALNNGGLSAHSLYGPVNVALDGQGDLYVADYVNNRVLEYNAPLSSHQAANRVFGQPDFTHNSANNGGVSANSLYAPQGVALDAQGNLYVVDHANHRVLEYDNPLTHDTTADHVFGQPDFSHNLLNNGGISASSLNAPGGVALDAQGDLYVADTQNNRVLEYDSPLTLDTTADHVFGQPDFTHNTGNNGGVSASSLSRPTGVALDAQGDLYVADWNNQRVLEYDEPLTHDTTADLVFGQPDFTHNTPNNGGLSADSLYLPIDVALDAQGDLYVVDFENNRMLEYDTPFTHDTTADRVFGQPDFTHSSANNGGISASSLDTPEGLALDAHGDLYVADYYNNRVLEYDLPVPHGVPSLSALSPSSVARGGQAFTLTVDGSGFVPGSVVRWNGSNRPTNFVSNTQLEAAISAADFATGGPFPVTVFTPSPGGGASNLINLTLYTRAGQDATADMEQGQPNFKSSDVNNLLVLDANRLNAAVRSTTDAHSGRLFVADTFNNRVLSWPNGAALANAQPADLVLGQPNFAETLRNNGGISARSLALPFGLAVDARGDLYVADYGNHRVLEYNAPLSTHQAANRVFGQGGVFTTGINNNGGISANSLNGPADVALDAHGNLYVADHFNHRVLEYDNPLTHDTTADRVFGQPDFSHNTANNGGVSAHSMNYPAGVAADAQGNLYVADQENYRVLEYDNPLTHDTTADRVFGQPDFSQNTSNNGGTSASSLSLTFGVALDRFGNLYVADYGNNRVLEYDSPTKHDTKADRVFGQPDFTHHTHNYGGLSAKGLYIPQGVAIDSQNNLYVADTGNNRILEYDWAFAHSMLPLVLR